MSEELSKAINEALEVIIRWQNEPVNPRALTEEDACEIEREAAENALWDVKDVLERSREDRA